MGFKLTRSGNGVVTAKQRKTRLSSAIGICPFCPYTVEEQIAFGREIERDRKRAERHEKNRKKGERKYVSPPLTARQKKARSKGRIPDVIPNGMSQSGDFRYLFRGYYCLTCNTEFDDVYERKDLVKDGKRMAWMEAKTKARKDQR